MQNRMSVSLTCIVAMLLLLSVPAFPQTASPGDESAGKMSSSKMMRECRQHCSEAHQSIDLVSKTADEVKHSKDPALMHSALQAISKSLAESEKDLSMCMNMMSMVEHKGGMAGMKGMEGKQAMEGMRGMRASPSGVAGPGPN